MKQMKIMKWTMAALLAGSVAGHAALLTVDFESDTVGSNPVANTVAPGTASANIYCTVVDSSVNIAGTGNGVHIFDNTSLSGGSSRVGYDFSDGESAVRYDLKFARLSNGSANNFTVSMGAKGGALTSAGNRYFEVRLSGNGNLGYLDNGTATTITGAIALNTSYTLSIYANDSDSVITGYETGHDLAANSVDYWLDGTYLATGGLKSTLSDVTTAGFGRAQVSSGTGDVGLDYVFDDLTVTAIPEPATLGLVASFAGGIMFIRRRFTI